MKFIGTKEIETEKLILRKLTVNDAEEAYKNWCSSYNVSKYVMWKKHENIEETKKLFKMWEKEYEDLTTFRWIVELKETNELIGTIDVASKRYLSFGTCEIGYCYGEKFWGKGYGTEALKAVIKYLFEKCDAKVIYADFMKNNPGSGKVMEKSGMTFEGYLRSRVLDKDGSRNDLGVCSITKEEYFKK